MDDFDEAVLKEGRMTDDFEPNFELGIQPNTANPDIKPDISVKSDSQSEAVFDVSIQDQPSGSSINYLPEVNKDDESSGRLTLKLKKKLCKMIAVSFSRHLRTVPDCMDSQYRQYGEP